MILGFAPSERMNKNIEKASPRRYPWGCGGEPPVWDKKGVLCRQERAGCGPVDLVLSGRVQLCFCEIAQENTGNPRLSDREDRSDAAGDRGTNALEGRHLAHGRSVWLRVPSVKGTVLGVEWEVRQELSLEMERSVNLSAILGVEQDVNVPRQRLWRRIDST